MRPLLAVKLVIWLMPLGLAMLAGLAQAAQLGAVLSRSAQDQPLQMTMQLKLEAEERWDQLQCGIASLDQFTGLGLSKPSFAESVRCQIRADANAGMAVLSLQSEQVLAQAIMHLVLSLQQATQSPQLLLVDVIVDPDSHTLAYTPDVSAIDPVAATPSPSAEPQRSPWLVSEDQTLIQIARQLAIPNHEIAAFMLALWQRNPQAFIQGNMHLLKQGSVLDIPDAAVWQSLDAQLASQQVQAQAAEAQQYRQALAAPSSASSLDAPSHDSQADHTPNATRDIVRLSQASGLNGRDKPLTVAEEMNALRDELAAYEVTIKEANQKTAALEKQIQQMQALLLAREKSQAHDASLSIGLPSGLDWAAQHRVIGIVGVLVLVVLIILAVMLRVQSKANQRLQAMAEQLRQAKTETSPSASLSPSPSVSQQAAPIASAEQAAVLEKTQALIQAIDLNLAPVTPASNKTKTNIDMQFDLVASYLDIGDHIGASTLLQQIILQGNPAQQARAKALLGKIQFN